MKFKIKFWEYSVYVDDYDRGFLKEVEIASCYDHHQYDFAKEFDSIADVLKYVTEESVGLDFDIKNWVQDEGLNDWSVFSTDFLVDEHHTEVAEGSRMVEDWKNHKKELYTLHLEIGIRAFEPIDLTEENTKNWNK